ncbi:hypothetical protein BDN72DRAFT_188712 [Pluteus cervinus]|uniref:Uncharacterized protein n=1 Tax=Pluteus cervinus TaxID=181527 RepID=A0ACD3AL83_9AGAR|nr:hypothetical protein BDN72DRAFT_188712 [Pluteus cervinus]
MARFIVAAVILFASLYSVVATAISANSWNTINIQNNVTFAYLDGGPPSGSQYTTVIILHGDGFNSNVFTRLIAKAHDFGWRVIAVNRRDYAPTTLLSTAELAPLSAGYDGEVAFFRQRGKEVGLLIEALISKHKLPAAQGNIKNHQNGIVLVGWSLGCVTTHAFLANLDALPTTTLNTLQKYIHTVLQHDPAQMGWAPPPQHDLSLWFNPDLHQRFTLFSQWARSFFKHNNTDPKTGNINDIDFNNPTSKPPTFSGLSTSVVNTMTDYYPFAYSEMTIIFLAPPSTALLFRRAAFDKTLGSYLPQVRVRYYSAAETPGILMWTVWQVQKTIANPSFINGVKARDVKYWISPKGNHFVFWDDADWTIGEWIKAINL